MIKKQEVERIQGKYLKWYLSVDRNVLTIWKIETGRGSIWSRTVKRAWNYERKLREKDFNEVVKEIIIQEEEERRERRRLGRSLGEIFEELGLDRIYLEEREAAGEKTIKEIGQRIEDIEAQEIEKNISAIEYTKYYKSIMPKDKIAKYLKSWEGSRKQQICMAR